MTRLLADLSAGREGAGEALLPIVYDELHSMARIYMRGERPDHTLQTTALVHEAYLRLGGTYEEGWESQGHFMRVAAQAMRRILIDHARSKHSLRRGGDRKREPLDEEAMALVEEPPIDFLALDCALKKLADVDPRIVQVIELRFFAGLSVEDTAKVLAISPRTVKYEWRMAKAWLMEKIA
ncbi:MAG: sigma-70 family RNA polymerase sigma factor [Planctomycetota bacterium]